MLISLEHFGVEKSVNPKYVTSVVPFTDKSYTAEAQAVGGAELWVVGNAGYGTCSIKIYDATVAEVTDYLNACGKGDALERLK